MFITRKISTATATALAFSAVAAVAMPGAAQAATSAAPPASRAL